MANIGEGSSDKGGSRTNLQSDSVTIDPSHELCLYPSDNPSNALVSNLLDGQNYGHWRKTVEIALIAKNKIGFVRGTWKKPDLDSPLANQWERCDKMVISWFMNSVIKSILDNVLFSNSSAHIWKQLELRYGQVDRMKIFQIQRDLCSISQENMSIADYYTQLKLLWDDYSYLIIIPTRSCGEKCQTCASVQHLIQDQQIIQFLVGLNEAYKVVRGCILMMRPFPDISEIYNILLQEENQRGLHSMAQISPQSVALQV